MKRIEREMGKEAKELKIKLEEKEGIVEKQNREMKEKGDVVEAKEKDIGGLKAGMEELKAKHKKALAQMNLELDNVKASLDKRGIELHQAKDNVQILEENCAKFESDLKTCREEKTALKETNTKLTNDVAMFKCFETQNETLKTLILQKDSELEKLNKDFDSVFDDVNAKYKSMSEQGRKKLEEANASTKEKEAKISQLEGKLAAAEHEKDVQVEEIKELEATIQSLNNKIQSLSTEAQNLAKEKDSQEQEVIKYKKLAGEKQNAIDSLERSFGDAEAKLQDNEAKLKVAEAKKVALEKELDIARKPIESDISVPNTGTRKKEVSYDPYKLTSDSSSDEVATKNKSTKSYGERNKRTLVSKTDEDLFNDLFSKPKQAKFKKLERKSAPKFFKHSRPKPPPFI